MKLIRHDAFFNDPWTDLDRLFESTFPEFYAWSPLRLSGREQSLPLDVYETADARFIRLEMPGVRKKDIEIELENAVLSVKARREETNGEHTSKVELSRSISIGDDVDADKVKARLEDGILTIELQKREQARPKLITIN